MILDRVQVDGRWVPVIGPEEPTCQTCSVTKRRHYMREGPHGHRFVPPQDHPHEHEQVSAMVSTEWYCHACKAYNDVWGTGATETWMECGSCGAYSWLNFDPVGFGAVP